MIRFFNVDFILYFLTAMTPARWAFLVFFREDFFARRGAEPCHAR